jgi:flagellar biosynthesis protein FlhA
VLTAGILTVLGLMPGMPSLPCFALAIALGFVARKIGSPGASRPLAAKQKDAPSDPKKSAADADAALALDLLCLEVGYELVALVDASRGGTLLDRVGSLRQQLARELGVIMPPIHVCDNLELAPGTYRLLISGNEVGRGTCMPGRLLAVDPKGTAPPIDGEKTLDPTFGMPARWIALRDKEMAEALGYAVVDHASVVATHLGELLRANAHKLLGRQEVQHLLEVLSRTAPKVVDDVVPNLLSLGDVLRVLRNLVREGISIRDLRTILEAVGELSTQTKDVEQLTELVRERLAAHITSRVKGPDGKVAVLTLDPRLEDAFRKSLREIATGTGGAVDPEMLRTVTSAAESALKKFSVLSATPLIVTSPDIRRYVRAVFERKLPQIGVVSFREIDPSAPIHILDRLVPNVAPLPQ